MRRKNKGNTYMLLAVLLVLNGLFPAAVFAAEPPVEAVSAILMDEPTGKVLFEKDADKRMFPASTTKILTALVALDYIAEDDLVVAGNEVYAVPPDSSKAGHVPGETLRGDHLFRGLMIPSGNETACVVALEVAKRYSNDDNDDLNYAEAERIFCGLMNEKAKSLGAVNSNFVNPHGYHDPDHYTTARDIALITREAMKNQLIRRIVKEKDFEGNGAGENPDPALTTQEYRWATHNELLIPGDYYYEYATGIKTGFTDEAGASLVASAEKDGKQSIAVVFFSPDPGRWTDAKKLFDYGFETFSTETVQTKGQKLEAAAVANPRLGDSGEITAIANDDFSALMSKEELSRVVSEITYNADVIAPTATADEAAEPDSDKVQLKTPIAPHDVIGKITYTLDGEPLFTGNVLSGGEALERTFNTDFDFYFSQFKNAAFSLGAVPFWVGGAALLALVIVTVRALGRKKYRRNNALRKRY
ncbi:MAG: D-alanyl-D-alanine carboxypeptidase [Clostridiales bacterium]|nr:D-alanyl-D-alanine carboxypeptidase [Clostridiales bacterium]